MKTHEIKKTMRHYTLKDAVCKGTCFWDAPKLKAVSCDPILKKRVLISDIIKQALKEDIGNGDITTNSIIPKSAFIRAEIIAKDSGIIAGLDAAKQVFQELNKNISFRKKVRDGELVKKGMVIAEIKGNARAILAAERVALNFLQRLSGIATLTARFVKLAGIKKGRTEGVKILDTRKTTPLMRELEKYAVKAGGGKNHRFGLYDAILIKDNHIEAAGSITEAVKKANRAKKAIEVEVKNLKEVREALNAGVGRLLLDNMGIKDIKKAVKLVKEKGKRKIKLEVSGGVNLNTIKAIAGTGVDYVSIGALTHSAKALDLSLEVVNIKNK